MSTPTSRVLSPNSSIEIQIGTRSLSSVPLKSQPVTLRWRRTSGAQVGYASCLLNERVCEGGGGDAMGRGEMLLHDDVDDEHGAEFFFEI